MTDAAALQPEPGNQPPAPAAVHTVLSLDLGSNTGWCIGQNNKIIVSGTTTFHEPGCHPGLRFLRFRNWLVQFAKVKEIFYEDTPMYSSLVHARVNCGMLAVLQSFSLEFSIPVTCMHSMSIKKAFTGSGRAEKGVNSKQPICDAAHALGWTGGKKDTTMCNDEADAIAIYFSIMQRRGFQVTFKDPTVAAEEAPAASLITPADDSALLHQPTPSGL